ncbi:MAG: UvrD-helicase domain-containing protein [Elusimicrobiales bacterium]
MTNELADIKQRLDAKYTFGRNVIVDAGAGTGKTRLLTERLAFWIIGIKHGWLGEGESPAERLVALTFTEKAAAELKLRLCARLADAASGFSGGGWRDDEFLAEAAARSACSPAEMGKSAALALQRLDRAQIGTIHSFASHVLRLYPVEAGIDPASEIDAGAAFDAAFDRLWRNWLEEELSGSGGREALWKKTLRATGMEELRALARALCGGRLENYDPRPHFTKLAEICAAKARRAAELSALYAPANKPRALEKALDGAAASLAAVSRALENGDFSAPHPAPENKKPAKPANWPDQDFEEAKALLSFAATATVSGQAAVLDAAELIAPFAAKTRAAYAGQAMLSFDDLLLKSRNLLRDNPSARAELKARFKTLLIDEFQDTDPLQGELLLYLAEEGKSSAPDWQSIRLEPGKLFIVGDSKQSIYRFRGADIRAYGEFEKLMESQGALRCALSVNFRSGREIVEAVNSAVPPVMQPAEGMQPAYSPITPCPQAQSAPARPRVEIFLAPPPREGAPSAGGWRRTQAEFIGGWIEENSGSLEIEPGRKLALKDVALLFRSATGLDEYLNIFKRRGIRYAVEEDRFFYSAQETADLMNLLKAASDPADKTALCGALRSPLGGLDDGELYALSRANGLDYTRDAPSGFEAAGRLYAILRELNSLAASAPLDDFVGRAIAAVRAPEILGRAYHGEQTVSNIAKFARIAAAHSLDQGLGLSGFISRAGRFMEDRAREGESPLADEFTDAVRVMTVHKAKGLEFPVVFLPDITARRRAGSGEDALCDWACGMTGLRAGKSRDCAMAVLEEQQRAHENFEEARIFYVAMTRARSRLILAGNREKPPEISFGGFLAKAGFIPPSPEEEAGFRCSPLAPVKDIPAQAMAPQPRRAAEQPPRAAEWAARWRRRLEARDAEAGRRTFATPTGAERDAETGHIRQEISEFAGPDRLLIGKLCHRVLELHDFSRAITRDETERALNYFAFQHHVPDYKAAADEAFGILSRFAASGIYGEIAAGEILGRELPFALEQEDGSLMRGVIDMAFRREGKLVLFDYKTEAAPAGGEAAAAEKYRAQARAYRKAAGLIFGEDALAEIIFLRSLSRAVI